MNERARSESLLPVKQLGLSIFRDTVLFYSRVRGRVKSILLESIRRDRNGELVDRMLIKAYLQMLVDVDPTGHLYLTEFEDKFLEETRQYYSVQTTEYLAHSTVPDYLKKVLLVPPFDPFLQRSLGPSGGRELPA